MTQRYILNLIFFSIFMFCAPGPIQSQIPTGPDIGVQIPNFSLPDESGKIRNWASLTGPNGGILAFNQSVDWCPWCRTQIVEMQESQELLLEHGLHSTSISVDRSILLKVFAKRKKLSYPLLADTRHVVIERFGIINPQIPKHDLHYGVPHPGQYLLDTQGAVRAKYFGVRYHGRATPRTILVREFDWTPENMQQQDTPDLTVRYGFSDQRIRPDNHVTLVLDISLKPNVHLFPPDMSNVQALTWTLENSGLWDAESAEYPATTATITIDGTQQPAYAESIRILQKIHIKQENVLAGTLGGLSESTIMRLSGALTWQGQNGSVMGQPRSLPLTFEVVALPYER
jgi:peroxiredoxin